MKTYLVGYDLNKPGKDYATLIKTLKESFDNWWHHLDSTWIIKTDLSATEIRNKLQPPIIDSTDELLVVRVTGEWASWGFDEDGVSWLKNNMS
jgi:hypothetical protein